MPTEISIAQEVLRGLKREVIQEGTNFIIQLREQRYVLREEDLQFYCEHKHEFRKPLETQLHFPGNYEHVIRFEGIGPRRGGRLIEENFCLTSPDGTIKIEIGRPSTLFCLSLTDTDRMSRDLYRFYGMPNGFYRREEIRYIDDIFRLSTIKLSTSLDSPIARNIQKMHELAESAIFHIAYGYGVSISFTRTWERTYYWLGRKGIDGIQFPLRTYNSELISYYNLALASESLVLGYLALYKILEYFFTSVSENELHKKIKEHLVSPDFSHTKSKKLRDLVKTIRQFENKMDELSALKLVINSYFEKDELREWVEEYERNNGEYFTTQLSLFGTIVRVDSSDSTIVSNIASRIYLIRNALVHNKEGEVGRFVPYSGQEELIHKEVQILLFLAEQMIIKTGKDLS